MRPLLKRNILVALICALPAVLGAESATGHSGGSGSSSGAGSSGGHGGGNFPSGHSSTGINSGHMSGASLGGRFATNPMRQTASIRHRMGAKQLAGERSMVAETPSLLSFIFALMGRQVQRAMQRSTSELVEAQLKETERKDFRRAFGSIYRRTQCPVSECNIILERHNHRIRGVTLASTPWVRFTQP